VKDLKFAKDVSFLNLIEKLDASNVERLSTIYQLYMINYYELYQLNVCFHNLDFVDLVKYDVRNSDCI